MVAGADAGSMRSTCWTVAAAAAGDGDGPGNLSGRPRWSPRSNACGCRWRFRWVVAYFVTPLGRKEKLLEERLLDLIEETIFAGKKSLYF